MSREEEGLKTANQAHNSTVTPNPHPQALMSHMQSNLRDNKGDGWTKFELL